MKRIVSTWPYALGVAILAIGWLLIATFTAGNPDLDGLPGLWVGTVVPLAAAAGGVVLTLRRGYDWVTVVVCVAIWVVFAVIGLAVTHLTVPLPAIAVATGAYLVIAHVGVVAVLALRRMGSNGPSAGV